MNRDARMRTRLKRGSNVLLPLDSLPSALQRRIRGPIFANHQKTDRAEILRGPAPSLSTYKPSLMPIATVLRSTSKSTIAILLFIYGALY